MAKDLEGMVTEMKGQLDALSKKVSKLVDEENESVESTEEEHGLPDQDQRPTGHRALMVAMLKKKMGRE